MLNLIPPTKLRFEKNLSPWYDTWDNTAPIIRLKDCLVS